MSKELVIILKKDNKYLHSTEERYKQDKNLILIKIEISHLNLLLDKVWSLKGGIKVLQV